VTVSSYWRSFGAITLNVNWVLLISGVIKTFFHLRLLEKKSCIRNFICYEVDLDLLNDE
jgi:hypothetical protein